MLPCQLVLIGGCRRQRTGGSGGRAPIETTRLGRMGWWPTLGPRFVVQDQTRRACHQAAFEQMRRAHHQVAWVQMRRACYQTALEQTRRARCLVTLEQMRIAHWLATLEQKRGAHQLAALEQMGRACHHVYKKMRKESWINQNLGYGETKTGQYRKWRTQTWMHGHECSVSTGTNIGLEVRTWHAVMTDDQRQGNNRT